MEESVNYHIFSELTKLMAVIIIASLLSLAVIPYFLSTSKIEEGTIVQRDDSTTTIIIPDKR